jgi:TolA-binding protein
VADSRRNVVWRACARSGRPIRSAHWPSIRSPRPSGLKDDHVASDRPSIGRRIFRTLTRFFIAVLIGIGATLAWQSHGDAARDMVVARAPSLGWLFSVSTTKSPAVAATAPDPVQQLEPLASNLDVVRRSVEQLAAQQEQMAQNIATLQAVEEDIRQKVSSPSQQAASIPRHKPPQPNVQSSAVQSSSAPRPPPPAGPPLLSR